MPLSPADAAVLVKAAAAADEIVAAMEKEAIFGAMGRGLGAALNFGKQMFRGGPRVGPQGFPTASPSGAGNVGKYPGKTVFGPPSPAPSRMPSLGRVAAYGAATTGAVGGAGLGAYGLYGHAQNQAQNSPDAVWYNPLTWSEMNPMAGPRPSRADVFQRNNQAYTQQAEAHRHLINKALSEGNQAEASRLRAEMASGDFGGPQNPGFDIATRQFTGNWNPLKSRMFGLNPFAQPNARTHRDRAMEMQRAEQNDYNSAMGRSGPQSGDADQLKMLETQMAAGGFLPTEHDALKDQIAALKKRMASAPGVESTEAADIRKRMEAAGMRFGPYKGTDAPPPGGGPVGTWAMGGRPFSPGTVHGWAVGNTDYREDPRRPAPPNIWEGTINPTSSVL